jgi:hypothetical protein
MPNTPWLPPFPPLTPAPFCPFLRHQPASTADISAVSPAPWLVSTTPAEPTYKHRPAEATEHQPAAGGNRQCQVRAYHRILSIAAPSTPRSSGFRRRHQEPVPERGHAQRPASKDEQAADPEAKAASGGVDESEVREMSISRGRR